MPEKHVYTIPPGADFLQSLVHGLKDRLGAELPRALILLPTRRACQNLRDAFLKDGGGIEDAMLLPDIRPLSEVEEEELMLSAGEDFLREVAALPRAIDPMRRRMLLAEMVVKLGLPGFNRAQAFLLANDLGHLIDDALIEGCLFDNLKTLVPIEKDYALHWQNIVEFLKIITEQWPNVLKAEQAIDAVDRRQRLTKLLIKHWQNHAPDYPVIAAGSTGSQPVTGDLLKLIATLPKGAVILPGLDTHLEEEAWSVLEPSHPQFLMARLLKKLECERGMVQSWPAAEDGGRAVLLSETMRPSEATDQWRHLRTEEIPSSAWQGLGVIEAAQEHQQAFIAALMLRKAADGEGTAALITPDRALAKRVVALMRRWNIEVDDSAGTPLAQTPVGSYLGLLLDLPDSNLRPSQLMAFFKHPFTGAFLTRDTLRSMARKLEIEFFRDHPRGRGIGNWSTVLKSDPAHAPFVEFLQKLHKPLEIFAEGEMRGFSEWLNNFEKTSEILAADKDTLWREREGEVLAGLFESLRGAADNFSCTYSEFAEMLKQALRDAVVRRAWGQHPRIAILGLLEARLLRFDHVILAGLNEGIWPEPVRADPWMSPAMRVDLGCADPDQRIGQMAHDFVQQAAGASVSLLRSQRQGEAPTITSRWLRRLEAVRELVGGTMEVTPWAAWASAIDFCDVLEPCEAPAVSVPHTAMPSKLSPSAIELWMRDPYAFYARHVLQLNAVGALDAEFTVRERGTLIHRALEKLSKDYRSEWPESAAEAFVAFIRKGLLDYGCTAEEREILSARLGAMAHEYWQFENERRKITGARVGEARGAQYSKIDDYAFELTARADRIDELNGGISILDYKTSILPTKTERDAVLKPQLYIEAIMADAGVFKDGPRGKTTEIAYVHFDQNQGEVEFQALDLPSGAVEEIHKPGLHNFIRAFLQHDARFRAAPRPQWLDPAEDYARLARVSEWSKGAVTQEEGDA